MSTILKKESFMYGFGHILTRIVSFLLLPFFTNIFTQAEYGTISLIYIFLGFFTVFLHFGLDASLMKYYKNDSIGVQKKYVSNIYIPILIVNILFLFFCFLLRGYLAVPFIGINDSFIFLMVILILFFDVLWGIPMIMLRLDNKPIKFISYNLTSVLSNLFCIYLFVSVYNMGIWGVVLSGLVSSGLLFIITLPPIIPSLSIKFINKHIFKEVFSFGFPLLFAGIFSMTIELSDRYIIKYLLEVEQVGVYSAGYKLGMLMLLLVMAFNMAWQPFFLNKKNQSIGLISSISDSMFLFFSLFCFFIISFAQPLASFKFFGYSLVGGDFVSGLSVLPWICAGYLFHGAYILQLPGPYTTKNTLSIAIIRGIGAIMNVVLNFILIPFLGIDGAAISTFITFLIITVLLFLYNKKIYPINYNIYNVGCLVFVLITLNVFISYSPPFLMRLIFFISILCFLVVFQVLKKESFKVLENEPR